MKGTFRCADKYQAQKLAGLAHSEEGTMARIAEIIDVIDTECLLMLGDSSVHSIMLYDESEAAALADFVQSVKDGEHAITASEAAGDSVIIEKS